MAVEIDNLFFDNIIEQSFFKFYHFLSSLISSILCKLFYSSETSERFTRRVSGTIMLFS